MKVLGGLIRKVINATKARSASYISPMQSDIKEVTEFYGSDLNKTRINTYILHVSVDAM